MTDFRELASFLALVLVLVTLVALMAGHDPAHECPGCEADKAAKRRKYHDDWHSGDTPGCPHCGGRP